MKSSTISIKSACTVAYTNIRTVQSAHRNGVITTIQYVQELMNIRDNIASLAQKASTRTAKSYIDNIVESCEYRIKKVSK